MACRGGRSGCECRRAQPPEARHLPPRSGSFRWARAASPGRASAWRPRATTSLPIYERRSCKSSGCHGASRRTPASPPCSCSARPRGHCNLSSAAYVSLRPSVTRSTCFLATAADFTAASSSARTSRLAFDLLAFGARSSAIISRLASASAASARSISRSALSSASVNAVTVRPRQTHRGADRPASIRCRPATRNRSSRRARP